MNEGFDKFFISNIERLIKYGDKFIEWIDIIKVEKECYIYIVFFFVNSDWW